MAAFERKINAKFVALEGRIKALEDKLKIGLIDDEAKEVSEPESESEPEPEIDSDHEQELKRVRINYDEITRCMYKEGQICFTLKSRSGDLCSLDGLEVRNQYPALYSAFTSHANAVQLDRLLDLQHLRNQKVLIPQSESKYNVLVVENGRNCEFHGTTHAEEDFNSPEDKSCRVNL